MSNKTRANKDSKSKEVSKTMDLFFQDTSHQQSLDNDAPSPFKAYVKPSKNDEDLDSDDENEDIKPKIAKKPIQKKKRNKEVVVDEENEEKEVEVEKGTKKRNSASQKFVE